MIALKVERRISWEAIIAAVIAAAGWFYTAGELENQLRQQKQDRQEMIERLSTLEKALQDHENADVMRHKLHEEASRENESSH